MRKREESRVDSKGFVSSNENMELLFYKAVVKIMERIGLREGGEGQEPSFQLALLAHNSIWKIGVQEESHRWVYPIFTEML